MKFALDTETRPIQKTDPLPEPVCISFSGGGVTDLVHARDVDEVLDVCERVDKVIGHNIGYDFGVLSRHGSKKQRRRIFNLYRKGVISDTFIRETLDRIEKGQSLDIKGVATLGALSKKYLGIELDKGPDSYRTRYGELIDVPLDEWPRGAINYAKADAACTRKIYDHQESKPDEVLQCRAELCLRLMSANGIFTDEERVDRFELELLERAMKFQPRLKKCLLVRKDGSRDTKRTRELVLECLGERTPRTNPSKRFPNGQIRYDDDTLRETGHPRLLDLTEWSSIRKLLDTYVPILRAGIDEPICTDYRVLAETGRTTSSRPNVQNQPKYPGARECFRARPGRCFVVVDLSLAELRSLAQVCWSWFGQSEMRDALIAGQDLHLLLAADMLGISYETALKRKKRAEERKAHNKTLSEEDKEILQARQVAKNMNFGLAGGLGADSFVDYVRAQTDRKIILTTDRARELKQLWLRRWPVMRRYFRMMQQITGDFGDKKITQFGSNRVRGGLRFTQAANTPFQGHVADLAKDAMWEVTYACYVDTNSPLYGADPTIFVHDELVVECDREACHEVGEELLRIMEEVQQKWLPDVPAKGDLSAMYWWSKAAKETRDEDGRLIPYEEAIEGMGPAIDRMLRAA